MGNTTPSSVHRFPVETRAKQPHDFEGVLTAELIVTECPITRGEDLPRREYVFSCLEQKLTMNMSAGGCAFYLSPQLCTPR